MYLIFYLGMTSIRFECNTTFIYMISIIISSFNYLLYFHKQCSTKKKRKKKKVVMKGVHGYKTNL